MMSTTATTTSHERPILFSGPMIRAILDGRKTQTRRAVKPQPLDGSDGPLVIPHPASGGSGVVFRGPDGMDARPKEHQRPYLWTCSQGQPGDRLWARETWYPSLSGEGTDWLADAVIYRADNEGLGPHVGCSIGKRLRPAVRLSGRQSVAWRPSIFMPRWASRLTLEITGVKVERLQDIEPRDAWDEGARCSCMSPVPQCKGNVDAFRITWESINGSDSWAANPWVWAISFRRLHA
jgi:hypothetical protein